MACWHIIGIWFKHFMYMSQYSSNIWVNTSKQQILNLWKVGWGVDCALNGQIIRMPPHPAACRICLHSMLWRQIRLWPGMKYSQGFNFSQMLQTLSRQIIGMPPAEEGGRLAASKKRCWRIIGSARQIRLWPGINIRLKSRFKFQPDNYQIEK